MAPKKSKKVEEATGPSKPMDTGKPLMVTVISGSEDLLRRRDVAKTIAHMQKKGWQVVRADGSIAGSLDEAMTRNEFFEGGDAPICVVVSNPDKVDVGVLREHATQGPSDIALLLEFDGTPAGNTKFGKFCADLGKYHRTFAKPKDHQAPDIARDFCIVEAKDRGCILPGALASALVEVSGTDLGTLAFEVMKVCMLAEKDNVTEITQAHAKGGVAALAVTPVSAIKDALQARNKAALVRALNRIKKTHKGDPTIHVTRVLGAVALGWLSMADLVAKGLTPEDIATNTNQNPWYVKNMLLPSVKRWGMRDLERLIRGIAEADRAVLNGAVSPWNLLNVRLLEACG